MIVKFELTLDDIVAFNNYHCAHSPTVKRARYKVLIQVSIVMIVGAFLVPETNEIPRALIVASALVSAGLLPFIYTSRFRGCLDRTVRRLLNEGSNKGRVCEHELEIDSQLLIERTDVNETRQSWKGVDRIEETDDYAFIYTTSTSAYVIPKRTIIAGDVHAFLDRSRAFWRAANPSDAGTNEG